MSTVSPYLDILRQTGADEVRLVPREPVAVIVAGRRPAVGGSPVSTRAMNAMIEELLTVAQQRELAQTGAQTITHEDGDERFAIDISQQGGETTMSLRRSGPRASPPARPVRIAERNETSRPPRDREEPRFTREREEPIRSAPEPMRVVPERGEPVRLPERSEPVRLPERSEPIRIAPERSEPPPGGGQRIDELLREMIARGASDLHLSADSHPVLRIHGEIHHLDGRPKLTSDDIQALVGPIMGERAAGEFTALRDADCAYEVHGLARFRVNVFEDRKGVGAVLRQIPITIVPADELGLPKACLELCRLTKGLVVVTGPTGSGKSTTLAAMIDHINRTRTDHIITIEDPIEFVHASRKCLINQREVGTHTKGFKQALRAALREDPDVVLVGEMRDLETVAIAIETAETGHLVFGTLHTTTAATTVDRMIDQFPADRQSQIRVMLSESLKGVIAQVLCKKKGGGRVAAHEVLLATSAVSALVRDGKTFQLPNVMQTGRALGMVTMNDSLFALVQNQIIEPREAWTKAVDKLGIATMLKNAGFPSSFD